MWGIIGEPLYDLQRFYRRELEKTVPRPRERLASEPGRDDIP
jgi:hypothetical protein